MVLYKDSAAWFCIPSLWHTCGWLPATGPLFNLDLSKSAPALPQVVGTLRLEVAAELGLPPGVQVAPGGGDNAMAALGVGAVEEGTWVLSLGTSGKWVASWSAACPCLGFRQRGTCNLPASMPD